MIQSMTGYGVVEHVEEDVSYVLEIRGVNHRYLKVSIKVPDRWQFLEGAIERVLRDRLSRGSVACVLRVRSENDLGPCSINTAVLQSYVDRLAKVQVPAGAQATIDFGSVLLIPGVTELPETDDETRQRQKALVETLTARLVDALIKMRREEGKALREALLESCGVIQGRLSGVAQRAPLVVGEYHERLKTRVAQLMAAGGFELQEEGLMREVAIFAERCDISEEVTRLHSHLDQFLELCDREEPVGRTLEFLAQEMLREANTIASKSNDAVIARHVVEIKGLIDRLKEQVQNVE